MTSNPYRIAERWVQAWSSFRAVVTTWPYGEDPDGFTEKYLLAEALETEVERLREIVYVARDAGIAEPKPVAEYQWVARFAAQHGRTKSPLHFGPTATCLLFDWFRDEQRSGEFDPFILADRLREVEDSEPALHLYDEILLHYFTSVLQPDHGHRLLSSLRDVHRSPQWRSHLGEKCDVWALIFEDLEEAERERASP
jgi:hypothetical protein